jgi:ubiquinone/menaquinone biosynthesis C-methylase UbiE
MGFYAERILPALIDLSMRNARLTPYRQRVVAAAEGRVLELGIGTGANLPYYGARTSHVTGLDPSPQLLARTAARIGQAAVPVELVQGSAERIPLSDASMDTVVMTWTGCSIPDVAAALSEMRRVLRPGGRLIFVEHGRSPEANVARWQDRLTPFWRKLAGGCHLNRPFDKLIAASSLRLDRLETGYMPGLRPLTFIYEGSAVRD